NTHHEPVQPVLLLGDLGDGRRKVELVDRRTARQVVDLLGSHRGPDPGAQERQANRIAHRPDTVAKVVERLRRLTHLLRLKYKRRLISTSIPPNLPALCGGLNRCAAPVESPGPVPAAARRAESARPAPPPRLPSPR